MRDDICLRVFIEMHITAEPDPARVYVCVIVFIY